MPCVNPDGTLTVFAKKVLLSLETPGTESEIAERVGTPIFRVRSNLREMIEFGLVREKEGVYQLVGSCDDDWDDPIPSPF